MISTKFAFPNEIEPTVSGLSTEAVLSINVLLNAHRLGQDLFGTSSPNYEDWVMIFVLLSNESVGRSTVTKDFVDLTGRAYGTIRSGLKRFEDRGYIRSLQKIGRSELYVSTEKLKTTLNSWSHELQPCVERLYREDSVCV